MRFWATIRNPPSSSIAQILPQRFRSVASGLIIESVRSVMIPVLRQSLIFPFRDAGNYTGSALMGNLRPEAESRRPVLNALKANLHDPIGSRSVTAAHRINRNSAGFR